MSSTTCPSCGTPVTAGKVFCVNCGTRVIADAPSVPPSGAPIGPPSGAPTGPMDQPGGVGQAQAVVAPPQGFGAATPSYPPAPSAPPSDPSGPIPMQQQYTEEIDTAPPGRLRADPRRLVLLSIMVLILSFIGRVAFMALTAGPQQEGEIIATLPVGPEGGEAKFAGRGELRVPKGALAKKQTLTVRRAPIRDRIRALSPFGGSPIVVPVGTQIIYLFGPVDVRFLRPVTIVLPAPPPPQRGLIFVFSNGQLRFLDAAGSRTVTIRVNSFDFAQRSTFVS